LAKPPSFPRRKPSDFDILQLYNKSRILLVF